MALDYDWEAGGGGGQWLDQGNSPPTSRQYAGYGAAGVRDPLATAGPKSDSMPMSEVDAKIAAAEARAETSLAKAMGEVRVEFASLRGDIRELKASTASKGTVFITGVTLFFGIAGLILAALSFGNDRFSAGASTAEIARAAAREAIMQIAAQPKPPTGS